jgi:hypothetical protein
MRAATSTPEAAVSAATIQMAPRRVATKSVDAEGDESGADPEQSAPFAFMDTITTTVQTSW